MAKRTISVEAKVLMTIEVEVDDVENDGEALEAAQEELEGCLIQTDFDAHVTEIRQARPKKASYCDETAHYNGY